MAAFDFPAAPLVGQAYSLNGVAFTWNGYGWVQQGNPAGVTAAYVDAQDALKVAKAGDTMSGDLTIQKFSTDHARLTINANVAGGYAPMILGLVEGKYCFITYLGKDFFIQRYNDAGAALDIPFQIYRSNGTAAFNLTTPSTSPTTGALTVAGGVGIQGELRVGGDVVIGGNRATFIDNGGITWGGVQSSAIIGNSAINYITFYTANNVAMSVGPATTQFPLTTLSNSPTTGALTVAGGVGIGGALNVNGTISSSSDIIGSALRSSSFVLAGGATGTLYLDNTATKYLNYNGAVFNFGGAPVTILSSTPSTSITTGALTVAGGVGIGGALHVAEMVSLDSAIGTPQIYIVDQTAVSIPGNSSAIIAGAGGYFFLVANVSQGQNGMYIGDNASQTNLVSGSNGLWVASTTTPAAGFASVAWDGTNFRIYNANAAAQFFRCCAIKIR